MGGRGGGKDGQRKGGREGGRRRIWSGAMDYNTKKNETIFAKGYTFK